MKDDTFLVGGERACDWHFLSGRLLSWRTGVSNTKWPVVFSILSSLIASEVEQDCVGDFQGLIFYQHNVI